MLKFLIFGDVVGKTGRQAVKKILPRLKKQYRPDLIIANAENLAHGSGVTPKTLAELKEAGVNVFTGGDHIFAKPDAEKIFAETDSPLLRPANMINKPGAGEKLLTLAKNQVLVVNLIGRVFIEDKLKEKGIGLENPFWTVEAILQKYEKERPIVLVDFHTEVTSEQTALGYFLDGRAAAVWGTHTHVPTADAKILPQGAGCITDVGMTGAAGTVLGVDKEIIIDRFVNESEERFEWPETDQAAVNVLYLEVDEKNKQTKKIKLIQRNIKLSD